MKIKFLDVGQGDSILIEWTDVNGSWRIGVVDCRKVGKVNPVLRYIKNAKYKQIEFLVMSHPHSDHYSGFLEVLQYLERESIPVKRFAHTFGYEGMKKYWKHFETDTRDTELLAETMRQLAKMDKSGIIERVDIMSDGKEMRIDEDVSINVLTPSHDDIRLYMKRIQYDADRSEKEASRAANLLSSLLRLKYRDFNFLLTSDVEVTAFQGALQKESHHVRGVKYHICQLPHHGSDKNYCPEFWKEIMSFTIQNAIASAGAKYKHPSFNVLKAFYDNGYKVYSTNIVNGMRDLVRIIEQKSKVLDCFSVLAEEYRTSNDRVFEVSDGVVKLVSTANAK